MSSDDSGIDDSDLQEAVPLQSQIAEHVQLPEQGMQSAFSVYRPNDLQTVRAAHRLHNLEPSGHRPEIVGAAPQVLLAPPWHPIQLALHIPPVLSAAPTQLVQPNQSAPPIQLIPQPLLANSDLENLRMSIQPTHAITSTLPNLPNVPTSTSENVLLGIHSNLKLELKQPGNDHYVDSIGTSLKNHLESYSPLNSSGVQSTESDYPYDDTLPPVLTPQPPIEEPEIDSSDALSAFPLENGAFNNIPSLINQHPLLSFRNRLENSTGIGIPSMPVPETLMFRQDTNRFREFFDPRFHQIANVPHIPRCFMNSYGPTFQNNHLYYHDMNQLPQHLRGGRLNTALPSNSRVMQPEMFQNRIGNTSAAEIPVQLVRETLAFRKYDIRLREFQNSEEPKKQQKPPATQPNSGGKARKRGRPRKPPGAEKSPYNIDPEKAAIRKKQRAEKTALQKACREANDSASSQRSKVAYLKVPKSLINRKSLSSSTGFRRSSTEDSSSLFETTSESNEESSAPRSIISSSSNDSGVYDSADSAQQQPQKLPSNNLADCQFLTSTQGAAPELYIVGKEELFENFFEAEVKKKIEMFLNPFFHQEQKVAETMETKPIDNLISQVEENVSAARTFEEVISNVYVEINIRENSIRNNIFLRFNKSNIERIIRNNLTLQDICQIFDLIGSSVIVQFTFNCDEDPEEHIQLLLRAVEVQKERSKNFLIRTSKWSWNCDTKVNNTFKELFDPMFLMSTEESNINKQ